jgi:leucyl-tRNA synthetase
MMFHHTALFSEDKWPEGIATWGLGTLEGQKMSSSKGHVVLPDTAIDEYGADTTRFFLFASSEPWQDFDWRAEDVEQYKNKLRSFYNRSLEFHNSGEKRDHNNLDRYALSRLQQIIENTTDALEDFQTRKAGLNAFFELNSLINNYRKRSNTVNREVANQLVETQIRLMAPFTPHTAEELWSEIENEGFVSEAKWPEPNQDLVDEEVENSQQLVNRTVEDIREVGEIVGEFDKVKIIVAEEWKRELFTELKEVIEERPEFGDAMGRLVQGRKQKADTIKSYLQEYLKEPGKLPSRVFEEQKELEILEENQNFFENEFDSEITVETEKESDEDKASRAEPGRPAIVME